MVKKITHITLSDHGYVFALGNYKFQKWLSNALSHRIILDPFVKAQIERFQFIFSPEQKKEGAEITSSSDFYSFAALSVYLFLQKEFSKISDIEWEKIPVGWRSFLKECLNEDPNLRPSHFLELKEYFNSPEIKLNQEIKQELIDTLAHSHSKRNINQDIKNIKELKSTVSFTQNWQKGYEAIKKKEFQKAHEIFEEMLKSEKNSSFDANLGLAILYYQKGDGEKSHKYLHEAKKIDAKKVSCFYKLIAFDI